MRFFMLYLALETGPAEVPCTVHSMAALQKGHTMDLTTNNVAFFEPDQCEVPFGITFTRIPQPMPEEQSAALTNAVAKACIGCEPSLEELLLISVLKMHAEETEEDDAAFSSLLHGIAATGILCFERLQALAESMDNALQEAEDICGIPSSFAPPKELFAAICAGWEQYIRDAEEPAISAEQSTFLDTLDAVLALRTMHPEWDTGTLLMQGLHEVMPMVPEESLPDYRRDLPIAVGLPSKDWAQLCAEVEGLITDGEHAPFITRLRDALGEDSAFVKAILTIRSSYADTPRPETAPGDLPDLYPDAKRLRRKLLGIAETDGDPRLERARNRLHEYLWHYLCRRSEEGGLSYEPTDDSAADIRNLIAGIITEQFPRFLLYGGTAESEAERFLETCRIISDAETDRD